MKTVRTLALAACMLAACSTSSAGAPAPSASPAASMAADLRTRLNLLLEEHVMFVAKQAEAASVHSDEYAGYAALLTANAGSLAQLVGSGFGNSAATQFASTWGAQNGYLIDYTIGLVTHNKDKSNSAASALVATFVPQVAQLITNMTQLPLDLVTRLENQQVTGSKAVIDDVVEQNYIRMYADLRATYADSPRLADLLAARMVQKFPDKFPGDPSDESVSHRVAINGLLQEHAYLTTMTTDAYVEARGTDGVAASTALAANASALERSVSGYLAAGSAPRFDNLWKLREFDLLSYANWGDTVARRWLTDAFAPQFSALLQAPAETVRDQLLATIKVIDDQRTRALTGVAAEDQAAAAAMQAIADRIALPSP